MPLIRRVPKRGFNHQRFADDWSIVNLDALVRCAGVPITPEALRKAGLIHGIDRPVKVLGDGTISKALQVHAHAFSESAKAKIAAAGGTVTVLPR